MHQRTEQEIMKDWKADKEVPVVSVWCTTYNHAPYIAEAIEGFLIQETDFPFEILICDDCSTDKTVSIVKEYADKYPTLIKPVYEKENTFSKGVHPGTKSLKIAKGSYIALCEGDDYWTDPLKLQKQVDVFENNKQISICFHPAEEWDMLSNVTKLICTHFQGNTEVPITDVIIGRGGYMPTASLMFKNIQMDKMIESFKDAPIGDFFIQIYMASLGKTYFLKDPMCVYRRNASGSWTDSQKAKHHQLLYYFKMVKGIDIFSPYLQNENDRITIYNVLKFYANAYLSGSMGVREKLQAIDKTASILQNYNRKKYKIDMYFRILKNKLLRTIK